MQGFSWIVQHFLDLLMIGKQLPFFCERHNVAINGKTIVATIIPVTGANAKCVAINSIVEMASKVTNLHRLCAFIAKHFNAAGNSRHATQPSIEPCPSVLDGIKPVK